MGQQLYIKREDMEAAGASFVTTTEEVFHNDEGDVEWSFTSSLWDIPLDSVALQRWYSYDEEHFCIDCNTWGSNYGVIMPWVEANNIPHTLG